MRRFLKNSEKCKDFSKWSCCNGGPAQLENAKIYQSGEKYEDFSKWWEMQRFLQNSLVVMGDLPRMENEKSFQGDEKYEDFSK